MPTIEEYVIILTSPREHKQDVIIKGGKTEQRFVVPFNSELINFLVITYIQNDKILLRKMFDDVTVVPENEDSECATSLIYYTINEAESFRFKANEEVTVQIKLNLFDEYNNENGPATSKIFKLNVVEALDTAMISETFENAYAIEVFNYGDKLQALNFLDIASGTGNEFLCKFLLDANWLYTFNFAVFKDEYGHIEEAPIFNNMCTVPSSIIAKPGHIRIGVKGVVNSETEYTSQWSNSIRIPNGCGE